MFLERWIQDQLEGCSSLKELQLLRLKKTLHYVYKESPFYRDFFRKSGVEPEDLNSLDDIIHIPFTDSEKLREEPYRFLCISLSQVKRIFTLYTSGTSGTPKSIFFSEADLERITDYMGAAMKSVALSGGITEANFRVYMILPNGRRESQAKLLARGVEKVGAIPILADLTLDDQGHIRAIEESRPHILFSSTPRIYRITQQTKGNFDLGKLGVKIVFLTSEYVPPAMRERLEHLWQAQVFAHYGMTEMGFGGGIECQAHDGFHFNEADFLFEVIDPTTGRVCKEGEEGELVLTTLNREAMHLIRYRTGDLATIKGENCPCGAQSLRRLGPLIRSTRSMVRLASGEEIYPPLLDDALYRIPHIIDYQVSLLKDGDNERLAFAVGLTQEWAGAREDITEALLSIPAISKNVAGGLMAPPAVEFARLEALKRPGRGKKLVLDRRSATSP